jgi:hypothetical protein
MHRIWLLTIATLTAAACRRPMAQWHAVSQRSGCTPALLRATPAFDTAHILGVVGTYELVQVDTARGWHTVGGTAAHPWPVLDLWAADSVHAHSRRDGLTHELVAANRPVVGALRGYEMEGFTADNPQAELAPHRETYLIVQFSSQPMGDGSTIWTLPVTYLGNWGFGGYYQEGAYVLPAGPDGEPLGQRAGFYCAFRRSR